MYFMVVNTILNSFSGNSALAPGTVAESFLERGYESQEACEAAFPDIEEKYAWFTYPGADYVLGLYCIELDPRLIRYTAQKRYP